MSGGYFTNGKGRWSTVWDLFFITYMHIDVLLYTWNTANALTRGRMFTCATVHGVLHLSLMTTTFIAIKSVSFHS